MIRTGRRYIDVLFALALAQTYDQVLGRLQLQKYIYLVDILAPIWEFVSLSKYQTYKHGPYDPNVQNAVDVLAFRGAVKVVESDFEKDQIRVRYSLSEIGTKIVEHARKIRFLEKKYLLYQLIAEYVNQRGWNRLKDLVYSDPTYLTAKSDGLGRQIDTTSLLSSDSLQILMGFNNLVRNNTEMLSKENLISFFFKLLDNYQVLMMDQEL
jgi:uncharacterized protein YwgA